MTVRHEYLGRRSFRVSPLTSARRLKQLLYEETDLPVEEQRLSHDGRQVSRPLTFDLTYLWFWVAGGSGPSGVPTCAGGRVVVLDRGCVPSTLGRCRLMYTHAIDAVCPPPRRRHPPPSGSVVAVCVSARTNTPAIDPPS